MAVDTLPPVRIRRPRVTLWLFRLVTTGTGLAVATQPVLAGRYLSGDFGALSAHAAVGGSLLLLMMLQVVTAILLWRPGHGPAWTALVAVGVLAGGTVQLTLGYSRNLAVHIPLGVALVAVSITLVGWAWTPSARRARP